METLPDGRPLRTVRSFVRRQGRLTARQERAIAEYWPRWGIDHNAQLLDLDATFQRRAPRNLEIGFGMGDAILDMAAQNPNEDFLGIEVFTPGLGNALDEIAIRNLSNIRVMKHDAVEVLEKQIANATLDHVYIFFPDPWHKKRHHKRRLISDKFITLIAQKIKPGGHLYLATDWQDYAFSMMETLSRSPDFSNAAGDSQFAPRNLRRPLTKFEKRGQRLGHEVWDLDFTRK